MAHLVFDHPAITILHNPEAKQFVVYGKDYGDCTMTYESVKEMGQAMFRYLESNKTLYVPCN